jgi:hypothetical protein
VTGFARANPGRALALAAAALGLVLALGACGSDDPSKVSVRIAPLQRGELVAERQLRLTLRGDVAESIRLEAQVEGGGETVRLVTPATIDLVPGRPREVALAVRAEAARIVRSCARRTVVVSASRGDGPSELVRAPIRTSPPDCGRFFAPDSVWNERLTDDAPIDPRSEVLVAELRRQVEQNYQSGFGPEINARQYGVPIYTVPKAQPTTRVTVDQTGAHTRELRDAFASVPLPPDARPAQGTDRHLVVWQPQTDTMWEFWNLQRRGDQWFAGWGGWMRRVSRNAGYFAPTPRGVEWGATATGLPLVGGLMTVAELQQGRIEHALAFALPEARANVWVVPAQRTDGKLDSPNAIPEGARFRIDPALDLDQLDLPPMTRMIAQAVQDYGMILRDQAGVVAFYGEDPASAGADPYGELLGGRSAADALRAFPWDRLQLLQMRRGT